MVSLPLMQAQATPINAKAEDKITVKSARISITDKTTQQKSGAQEPLYRGLPHSEWREMFDS